MKDYAKFWDEAAPKYSRDPIKDVGSWDLTLEKTRHYLDPSMDVLEVGAGTGTTALRLYESVKNYRATDFSTGMIEIAKEKRAQTSAPGLEFAVARIEEEPDGKYDALLAFNLLHLLPDVHGFAKEAHRVLKPGGVFISKSACISGKYAPLRIFVLAMQLFGKAPHLSYLSPRKLQEMIASAGFEILEYENIPKGSMKHYIAARKI